MSASYHHSSPCLFSERLMLIALVLSEGMHFLSLLEKVISQCNYVASPRLFIILWFELFTWCCGYFNACCLFQFQQNIHSVITEENSNILSFSISYWKVLDILLFLTLRARSFAHLTGLCLCFSPLSPKNGFEHLFTMLILLGRRGAFNWSITANYEKLTTTIHKKLTFWRFLDVF